MPIRIVIPRTVPCAEAHRVMWSAWTKGYASRAVMSVTPTGWMALEFLVELDEEPAELVAFEIELDDALGSITVLRGLRRVPVRFAGTGVWAETA